MLKDYMPKSTCLEKLSRMAKIGNPGCFEHKACISLENIKLMSLLDRYVHQGISVPHFKL